MAHVDAIAAYDHVARTGETAEAASAGWLRVAMRNDEVVGHAIVRPRVFFGHDFLDVVYVAEFARRAGVGRLLVRSVVDRAEGRVWSSTNLSNAPMHNLLRDDGWRPAGMLDGLDEGDPEIFYFAHGRPSGGLTG
jgi:GNAT superfamily N-acetyltransferase